LTIWILAAIAIVATFLAERVQRSLRLAQSHQESNDLQLELSNARAEILFRLATSPFAACGALINGCVALDDRPYALSATTVRLQDARGLLNLNRVPAEQVDRLLHSYGLDITARARLVDALQDHLDADSLVRLNGAEAPQYSARGLGPPRNGPLTTPLELRNVLGWAETRELWTPRPPLLPIDQLVTVGDTAAVNPNTAPLQVLQALEGVTSEVAQTVIARRELEPLTADLLDRLVGGGLMRLPPIAIAFPASSIRVTQSAPGLPWAVRYNVRLTPRDEQSPWRITYFHRLETPADAARATVTPSISPARFPPRPALAASSPGGTTFRAF
jgi:type II secretory pathway component PulK